MILIQLPRKDTFLGRGAGIFTIGFIAKDAQNNRTCDNIDKNIYITDAVAPKISSISSDKTNDTLNTYKEVVY